VPHALVGMTLADSHLRQDTGCNVLAVRVGQRAPAQLDVTKPLPEGGELILIGDREAEDRFFDRYAT
jgi:K+/H+ antiporter YhaU regulatory subunit KhtT